MNSAFYFRLVLDAVAVGLLVFGLSYWWLGNAAHELAGAAMFALLIAHNIFNRRFYRTVARPGREPRRLLNLATTFALLTAMVALLLTSVLISNALPAVVPSFVGSTARQIHLVAAYWALVIVAVHLGLRWPMIMGVARHLFGISRGSAARSWTLRVIAIAIAVHGVWSSFELGVGTKLTMQMTLEWWNFEEAVAGFFVHCAAIMGLYGVITYYAASWFQRGNPTAVMARGVGQLPGLPRAVAQSIDQQ